MIWKGTTWCNLHGTLTEGRENETKENEEEEGNNKRESFGERRGSLRSKREKEKDWESGGEGQRAGEERYQNERELP